jgi:hypothetical protein
LSIFTSPTVASLTDLTNPFLAADFNNDTRMQTGLTLIA